MKMHRILTLGIKYLGAYRYKYMINCINEMGRMDKFQVQGDGKTGQKFLLIFLGHLGGKPELNFWPTQYFAGEVKTLEFHPDP